MRRVIMAKGLGRKPDPLGTRLRRTNGLGRPFNKSDREREWRPSRHSRTTKPKVDEKLPEKLEKPRGFPLLIRDFKTAAAGNGRDDD